jgi:hypothetical protein
MPGPEFEGKVLGLEEVCQKLSVRLRTRCRCQCVGQGTTAQGIKKGQRGKAVWAAWVISQVETESLPEEALHLE